MEKKFSTKNWESFFLDKGISDDLISQYLPYIEKLNNNKVPVIFEYEHLSLYLGIEKLILLKMIFASKHFYRSFYIPKKRGGKRLINAPLPSLLHCQKWIYKNILLKHSTHECAHGFTPGKSIISNAKGHLSKKALLKIDLENFFPSIPINWVINLFSKMGYSNNVSFYLASLCCFDDALCQGAPTSPYISNLLLRQLDNRISKLSNSFSITYTRYADDLTFSGTYISLKFKALIINCIHDYGLKVNPEKTIHQTQPGKKIVTGISVAGKELKLPRGTKRELRKEIYYIKKYGFLSHASKIKINNPIYLYSLKGKFSFWLQVEPECIFAKESIEHIDRLIEIS
jgi:hypothetical protein